MLSPQTSQNANWCAIAVAGLVAAAIDAVYFSLGALLRGHSPVAVLQSIASFWLGPDSFQLGSLSALLGALTHVALATIMAAGFALLARRLWIARTLPVAAGAAYGLALYVLMYLVVMPLRWSQIYPRWDGPRSILDICAHVIIGISIALVLVRVPMRTSAAAAAR